MTDAGLSPHDRAHTWATTPLSVIQSGDYHPGADTIQVMTMKVSKGLEFPVVALPGVGNMPAPSEDEKEAARVFYVAVKGGRSGS